MRLIATLTVGLLATDGDHRTTWDGTDASGQGAASWRYVAHPKPGSQRSAVSVTPVR